MGPVTLLKTGNASLEASWRRLVCAGDKRARAYTLPDKLVTLHDFIFSKFILSITLHDRGVFIIDIWVT